MNVCSVHAPQVAAGGGVTVRPPRPATIYALAQRLRARSESQREEHCPAQESHSEGVSRGHTEGGSHGHSEGVSA